MDNAVAAPKVPGAPIGGPGDRSPIIPLHTIPTSDEIERLERWKEELYAKGKYERTKHFWEFGEGANWVRSYGEAWGVRSVKSIYGEV